ncbi:MAG: type II toxin-antitoxin system HicB family antitoxin [Methylococcaceae bacterium]|nr:MAG: type II toxin-antitoxin system HicB family antitoxin [Methylococcaceae bacterium]
MMTNDRFDGYSLNIYQDEEGDYLAHFVELPGVSAFADTPEQALDELATAWAGVKESYLKRGEAVPLAPSCKQYSGQFNVRIDKRLHRLLAVEAARAGVSLNSLVARKLAQSATHSAVIPLRGGFP